MKKLFLLLSSIALLIVLSGDLISADKIKGGTDELLRRSLLVDPNGLTSFPAPFTANNNPVTAPAISTGYYFVDSDDEAADMWRPNPEIIDTNYERNLWKRIVIGPRVIDSNFWTQFPDEGLRFFRNPAYPTGNRSYFSHGVLYATDSTDDAIAGPIPIGFSFFFNGIRYDSFYVSTNGIIALTNRRYFYDGNGNRAIPDGNTDCYDPMSMDWFDNTRPRVGNGLADPVPDDFGYQYSVIGNAKTTPQAGIRKRGGLLTTLPANQKAAVIAPFFADMHLSQSRSNGQPDDFGQVWFKRTVSADKLIIYFVNCAPKGQIATSRGGINAQLNLRPGDANFIAANAQVVLNRLDSSVTINMGVLRGSVIINSNNIGLPEILRYNTTLGVRGFARHVNYNQDTPPQYPWAAEYEQSTHYYSNLQNPNFTYPHNYLSIRFKQWKNTLRVVSIAYRVRPQNLSANLCYSVNVTDQQAQDYEILAGDQRLGSIQPVAMIQNLSNDIQGTQGVNYQVQELKFKARFRIINEATKKIIYNRLLDVDSISLALPVSSAKDCDGDPYPRFTNATGANQSFPGNKNYNGIPPYGYAKIFFSPFDPNPDIINQIGRLKAYIIAEPIDPVTSERYRDEWPFDDTTDLKIFVMRRLNEFQDDVTQFHIVDRIPMPSTLKWINIEAEAAHGDDLSYFPLPPRGEFRATNNPDFEFDDPDFTTWRLRSPVIRMNRITLQGAEPPLSPNPDGDELRSFPVDLRQKHNSVLTLSFQRGVKMTDWPRGWNDYQLIGPEPRTIINANPYLVWRNYNNSAALYTDSIDVEFAQPSPDGVQYITNIPAARWRILPKRSWTSTLSNRAAYTLYGSNGALRGFLETDKDSALSYPVYSASVRQLNGLRPDIYDDGFDYDYKKVFLPIPDAYINANYDGAKNFRFRLKVGAVEHKIRTGCVICIPDDFDDFLVDNVRILRAETYTDLEMVKVEPVWPYTSAPISQASNIPIKVKVANNTLLNSATFLVKVKVFRRGEERNPANALYCRIEQFPFLFPMSETEVMMPNFDAKSVQTVPEQEYRIVANVMMIKPDGSYGDIVMSNDTTYTDFTLKTGIILQNADYTRDTLSVFSYDPAQDPRNDVPDGNFSGISNKGLNLFGYARGGTGTISAYNGDYDEIVYGTGDLAGSGAAQFAVRFSLLSADTLKGYHAYFAAMNSSPDPISFSIYTGDDLPETIVPGTENFQLRGWGHNNEWPEYNKYTLYLLDEPVILPAGNYWVTVGQLRGTGIELGASKTRMGMRTTSVYKPEPQSSVSELGQQGYHLLIDKKLRDKNSDGNLVNKNLFAWENAKGSGNWNLFTPTVGNPGYAHLDHFGFTPIDYSTATLSRGSWIPMLRPYFGTNLNYVKNPEYNPCLDDIIPVTLVQFNGIARNQSIEVYWETSSEVNNAGFYVEKNILVSDDNKNWKNIGFVKGAGNSNSTNYYNFIDKDVKANTTYQYRLRQIDKDGVISCENYSKVITLKYNDTNDGIVLEQNQPNPFTNTTNIKFNTNDNRQVILEVLDIYGNVVKSLVNNEIQAGNHNYVWDGTNSRGELVTSGTYIYRLKVGDEVLTGKMSFVR